MFHNHKYKKGAFLDMGCQIVTELTPNLGDQEGLDKYFK